MDARPSTVKAFATQFATHVCETARYNFTTCCNSPRNGCVCVYYDTSYRITSSLHMCYDGAFSLL